MGDGGKHLRRAHVGAAEHPHFAVRKGLSRDPFNRVVTILGFVDEGIPLAVGSVAAAHVLQENDIATRGGTLREIDVVTPRNGPAVWRTLQEHREFALGIGPEDIAAQNDAVAHLDFNIAFDLDAIPFRADCGKSDEEKCRRKKT